MATGDPAQDLDVARQALASGDVGHALQHLASALAQKPFDERAHAVFEQVAQRANILSQLPDDGYLGTHLVRALALRRAGRLDEAVDLLAQLAGALGDRGFESLLAGWLVALGAERRRLGPEASNRVARLLVEAGESTIGLSRLRPGEQALLSGYADLASAASSCGAEPVLGPMAMGVLRRAGRFAEAQALRLPSEGAARQFGLTQQGLLFRAMGEPRRSVEAFEAAVALSPDDRSLAIEQARSWFVAGEFERALALLTPERVGGDEECEALVGLCRQRPEGDRLALLDGLRRAALGPALALPGDATANFFREHAAQFKPGAAKLKSAVSGWESPSNRLLLALYASGTGQVATAAYELSRPPLEFAPLSQRRGAGPPLWVERGGVIEQGPAAPPAELRAAIGRVSLAEGGFDALWAKAEALAQTLDGAQAGEVVAALVHPPDDAAWLQALPNALYRYQVAGACVLANLPCAWEERRDRLESLVFGPVDWTSAAAIAALGELARRDAEKAASIRALLGDVVADLVPHTCEPRFFPLLQALRSLPGVPREKHEALRAWYDKFLDRGDEEAPSEPAPAPRTEPLPAKPEQQAGSAPTQEARWPWAVAALVGLALLALLAALK